MPQPRKPDKPKKPKDPKKDKGPKKPSFEKGSNQDPRSFLRYLTGPVMKREMKAATRLQYRPVQRELSSQVRASEQRSKDIGDWFNQYQQDTQKASTATSAEYDKRLAEIAKDQGASSAQAEALRQKLASEEMSDAATRGAAYDPSGATTAAQANLARSGSTDTVKALLGGQGASQFAYLQDRSRIGEGEKVNQRLLELGRRRTLEAEKRELARERGAFRTDYRRQARQSERDFYLERLGFKDPQALQEAQIAADADVAEAKLAARQSRKEDKRNRRFEVQDREDEQRHDFAYEAAGDRNEPSSKAGPGGDRREKKKEVQRAYRIAKRLMNRNPYADAKPKDQANYWDDLIEILDDYEGVSPEAAARAVRQLRSKQTAYTSSNPAYTGGAPGALPG